jgi:hypothetical protein
MKGLFSKSDFSTRSSCRRVIAPALCPIVLLRGNLAFSSLVDASNVRDHPSPRPFASPIGSCAMPLSFHARVVHAQDAMLPGLGMYSPIVLVCPTLYTNSSRHPCKQFLPTFRDPTSDSCKPHFILQTLIVLVNALHLIALTSHQHSDLSI